MQIRLKLLMITVIAQHYNKIFNFFQYSLFNTLQINVRKYKIASFTREKTSIKFNYKIKRLVLAGVVDTILITLTIIIVVVKNDKTTSIYVICLN